MSKTKVSKEFECSFCGRVWVSDRPKITNRKRGTILWTEFASTCPDCGRETTLIEYKERRGE